MRCWMVWLTWINDRLISSSLTWFRFVCRLMAYSWVLSIACNAEGGLMHHDVMVILAWNHVFFVPVDWEIQGPGTLPEGCPGFIWLCFSDSRCVPTVANFITVRHEKMQYCRLLHGEFACHCFHYCIIALQYEGVASVEISGLSTNKFNFVPWKYASAWYCLFAWLGHQTYVQWHYYVSWFLIS